jgi:hypothetical protein
MFQITTFNTNALLATALREHCASCIVAGEMAEEAI